MEKVCPHIRMYMHLLYVTHRSVYFDLTNSTTRTHIDHTHTLSFSKVTHSSPVMPQGVSSLSIGFQLVPYSKLESK